MKPILINWELTLPLLDQMSVLRVYTTIVSLSTPELHWYSNEESRGKVAWRWQISPNTVKYAIGQLVKKGFLSSEARGVYKIEKRFLNVEGNNEVPA